MMHGHEKSGHAIVAVKPTNKAEQPTTEQTVGEAAAAESGEPRAWAEGKARQHNTHWTQSQARVSQALERIRQAARERKKERFTALFHHISIELLEEAFFELSPDRMGLPKLLPSKWKIQSAIVHFRLCPPYIAIGRFGLKFR